MLAIKERREVVQEKVPEHPTSGKSVCAVLVSFHPDPDLPARVSRILAQVGALVIVDNGSNEAARRMLGELSADSRIALEANRENLGIARALNMGIRRARRLGYDWVLLLDQDSVLDACMVDDLIATHASFPEPARLAVLGAGFRDALQEDPSRRAPDVAAGDAARAHADSRAQPPWEEVESVITSGSLLRVATLDLIGPFRDEFFIDYVDIEYCFRARAKGYRVIKTRKPLMSHAIGAASRHAILGIQKWTSNHSADRRYYMARNDTVMLKEYGRFRFGSWAFKSLGRRVRTCKRIALYEDRKLGKIAAVASGWWDGIRGHLGPRHRAAPR
ncbi:MAG: glycosyltransferase family 2 protein [Steroidobacteraceae bacterium]|jgi:rhamnosyltransferase